MLEEVSGIILSRRVHRERDFLVKIFTDRYGKRMFFVRGTKRRQDLDRQLTEPNTQAVFSADIRSEGFSFIRGVRDVKRYPKLQNDIEKNAYATYMCALTDVALNDHEPNLNVFNELSAALAAIQADYDAAVISNMFEIKRLREFGVKQNWTHCAICGRTTGPFDYSSKYHGILCKEHWSMDPRRLHSTPRAIHILRLLSALSFEKIGEIKVSTQTKKEMKRVIDTIYEEAVGIYLKSKRFIDQLQKYRDLMLPPSEKD